MSTYIANGAKALFILLLASPAFAQKPEVLHASCTLTNKPTIIVHYNGTKKLDEQEIDDWRVHCTATYKKDTVFDDDLELAHPTEFRDAMEAAHEFVKKGAQKALDSKRKHSTTKPNVPG